MSFPPILIPSTRDRAAQGAVLSLGRAGYPIVAALSPKQINGPIVHSCYLTETLECPDPLRNHSEFREWLGRYLAAHPSTIVLPIHEAVVHAAAHLRREGLSPERFVLPNSEGLANSLSKFSATLAAKKIGIATPETVFLHGPGDWVYAAPNEDLDFPCLLKWDNSKLEDGSYHKGCNLKIDDRTELDAVLAELKPFSCGVMAQELVPGHGVGAFFLRHKGRIVLRFAHRRLHEVPWTGGESALCRASDDDEVLEAGERLLAAVDYEGVAMVEFRKEDGKPPVFLEINGRLWGSLGLALAAGADFPRAMVACHLHGDTQVLQPDLSRRVRWREPKLEMDYLHSLWQKKPGPGDPPPPRLRGTLSVFWNLIDPRTTSDWNWRDGYWRNLRRHVGLWRREAAWLKQTLRRHWQGRRQDSQVAECVTRTKELLDQAARNPPRSLLFLCYGNICRSSYAEFRWLQWARENPSLPTASSGGFHEKVERSTPARFQSAARHRGVELQKHRSKRVSQTMVDDADWIIVMDTANLRDFQRDFPDAMAKTLLLGACDSPNDSNIPDPYGQPMGAGGKAYRRIDGALECLIQRLTQ